MKWRSDGVALPIAIPATNLARVWPVAHQQIPMGACAAGDVVSNVSCPHGALMVVRDVGSRARE